MLNNTPYSNKFLQLKMNIYAKLIYPRLSYRMRMSLQKGSAFYHKKGGYFYIIYNVSDLANFFGLSPYQVRTGLNALNDDGFIIRHWAGHFYRYELPKFFEFDTSDIKSFNHLHQKFLGSHREVRTRTNKDYSNTVNTRPLQNKSKFKKSSLVTCWKDSAKKMGLTLDTIDLIAEFSDTYNQNAYKIAGYIKEARDITANHYHVKKLARHFESNDNIINHLAKKLKILFTHITSKNDHKAKLSNYAGFLINSLKRFFKWAFGKGKDVTVKPKTDNRRPSSYYRKRKPEVEHMPQWYKDQQNGKAKPQKANKLLNKLNQANITLGDAEELAADPLKPSPSDDKLQDLKQRVSHYRKLFDAKSKPTKPKESKQFKEDKQGRGIHRTSKTLCNKIQERLKRLSEDSKSTKDLRES